MIDPDISKIVKYSISRDPTLVDRFSICEAYYHQFHTVVKFQRNLKNATVCFFEDDRIAWYLFHLDLYNNAPMECDLVLCARIVPMFKTFGSRVSAFSEIANFIDKFDELLGTKDAKADSLVTELLVAMAYKVDGKFSVEMLPETKAGKTPDIALSFDGTRQYVEVKKRLPTYDYYTEERKHWTRISYQLSELLKAKRRAVVYRITFHVELESLPDNFLVDLLGPDNDTHLGNVCNTEVCTISRYPARIAEARKYLENSYLRAETTQATEMLFGYDFELDNAITFAVDGKMGGSPFYYDDLIYAYAMIWTCDAPAAIQNHAKSFKKLLSKAVSQIPTSDVGAIHLVYESYQGSAVDEKIFHQLNRDVDLFEFAGREVVFIYLHVWKFRIPPNENWLVDQDCIYWRREDVIGEDILDNTVLLK